MNPQNEPKGEHYNLRWTNYLSNLSQIVFEHHLNERLVDVTLVCEGQYIRAHKLVLSACSNFFQDMFRINGNVTQLPGSIIHPFIVMNGFRLTHLKHIVDFMYQGEIKVIDSDLEGVLALGESLQVKGLCSVKLKQKIGINNETKPTEQSVSPVPLQPTLPKRQPIQVESKIHLENTKMLLPPLKCYSKVPVTNNVIPPTPLEENFSVNRSQEEPRNYSKVTLDALAQNNSAVQKVNNFVKEVKSEDKNVKIPTVLNQTIQVEEDFEEPINKKLKVNPPPLVIRRSDMIKIKPTTSEFLQKPKSPVIKEEKQYKTNNDTPQPIFVEAEKEKKNEIPRPPNAFMIFASEWRRKLAVEHPDESSKNISIRLGNLWKTLSPETKENYYQAAQAALKEHELKYPQPITIPEPLKKKKIILTTVKKFEPIGSSGETVDLQGDDDDLEIIESPQTVESGAQDSNSTSLST